MKNKIFIPCHRYLSFDETPMNNSIKITHNNLLFVVSIDEDYNEFNYLRHWASGFIKESTNTRIFLLKLKLTYTNNFYIKCDVDVSDL